MPLEWRLFIQNCNSAMQDTLPGKHRSAIYITHAHADHFFGLKLLRDRFPEARAIVVVLTVASTTTSSSDRNLCPNAITASRVKSIRPPLLKWPSSKIETTAIVQRTSNPMTCMCTPSNSTNVSGSQWATQHSRIRAHSEPALVDAEFSGTLIGLTPAPFVGRSEKCLRCRAPPPRVNERQQRTFLELPPCARTEPAGSPR